MELYIKGFAYQFSDRFETLDVSALRGTSFVSGSLSLPVGSPHYPQGSDLKIMRADVIASIMLVRQMLEKQVPADQREKIPLFVANGAFLDYGKKFSTFLKRAFGNITPDMEKTGQLSSNVYRFSPPLLILETLTNSSMSLIAQYTGLKGHNTTLGNTSIASFYALQEALYNCRDTPVVVVSSNYGGIYSFLSNSGILGYREGWKESSGSVSLLLSSRPENALARITRLEADGKVPDLSVNTITNNWQKIIPDTAADAVIFSGAYDQTTADQDLEYSRKLHPKAFSLFDQYGNMGPSNLMAGITTAVEMLGNKIKIADILDRDIYGRETMVRVESC